MFNENQKTLTTILAVLVAKKIINENETHAIINVVENNELDEKFILKIWEVLKFGK